MFLCALVFPEGLVFYVSCLLFIFKESPVHSSAIGVGVIGCEGLYEYGIRMGGGNRHKRLKDSFTEIA